MSAQAPGAAQRRAEKGGVQLMRQALLAVVLAVGLGPGCIRIKTEPVEVKPIHIVIDVNVRVAKELDNFFGDLDKADPTINKPATK
jgi:hypothetical protein